MLYAGPGIVLAVFDEDSQRYTVADSDCYDTGTVVIPSMDEYEVFSYKGQDYWVFPEESIVAYEEEDESSGDSL